MTDVARVEEIKKRLTDLDYELYNKCRNFWTGLKFTPDEAVSHYHETRRLEDELYSMTGEAWEHRNPLEKKLTPTEEFKRKRYLERHYPS